MGAIEASKPSTLKSTGLQLNKLSGAGVAKPRVIHTYSPRVYKIQPEEFLGLVQKLTGKAVPQPKRPMTIQFFETDASKPAKSKAGNSRSQETASVAQSNVGLPNSGEALGSPYTRNLLSALPSPRLVTLNFLPLLATPRARIN